MLKILWPIAMTDNNTAPLKERIDENVRKTVGLTVLRKIRKFVEEVEEEKRIERKAFFAIGVTLAALIAFGILLVVQSSFHTTPQTDKRPRILFVGSNTTNDPVATYAKRWTQRLEQFGTENYPNQLTVKGIYGSATLRVGINSEGLLERLEIAHSSGNSEIDEAAETIVRTAAPFEPFPDDVRDKIDVLVVTRTFDFTKGSKGDRK